MFKFAIRIVYRSNRCQLWALGRANGGNTGIEVVSSGDLVDTSGSSGGAGGADRAKPRSLTIPEVERYVQYWADASRNAVEAGFDGVEIHGARELSSFQMSNLMSCCFTTLVTTISLPSSVSFNTLLDCIASLEILK